MSTSHHSTRRGPWHTARLGPLMAGALIAGTFGAPAVAAAQPTNLFISEYIEGTGNVKALEIYNGTGVPVDLAAGQFFLDIYSNGSAVASSSIALTGTVASGDVHVIANASAPPSLLFFADATSAALDFDGNDAVLLRSGATSLDLIGQIGVDPGPAGWGTDPTNTVDNTLARKPSITAGRTANGAFDPAAEWDGYDVDTTPSPGTHSIDAGGGSGSDTGAVDVQVTIPSSAACLELSTTTVGFGTVPLGAEGVSATPDIGVTNCSATSSDIYARGTDAGDGAGAHWALVDSTATCADTLGLDAYRLGLVSHQTAFETGLATTNKLLETQPSGATPNFHLTIATPCPGSTGSGSTMSMQVVFLAAAAE